jgi:hypothetical protein
VLQDPYFRKHILTQFLIYLKAIKRPAPDVKAAHLTETQVSYSYEYIYNVEVYILTRE